ncbi:MAG: hypothetical protein JSU66_09050, partial [Deltaproteobacteria bacterium]
MGRTVRRIPKRRWLGTAIALACGLGWAARAQAFEAFDGRLEVHGFVETRFLALWNDFSDDVDLGQWANILNLEVELDIASAGWGPFDRLSAFSRVLVQYDCVWTRACGLSASADAHGDRANKVPRRLSDRRDVDSTYTLTARIRDRAPYILPSQRVGSFAEASMFAGLFGQAP